jgi:hypothetical protein
MQKAGFPSILPSNLVGYRTQKNTGICAECPTRFFSLWCSMMTRDHLEIRLIGGRVIQWISGNRVPQKKNGFSPIGRRQMPYVAAALFALAPFAASALARFAASSPWPQLTASASVWLSHFHPSVPRGTPPTLPLRRRSA